MPASLHIVVAEALGREINVRNADDALDVRPRDLSAERMFSFKTWSDELPVLLNMPTPS